MRRFRKHQWKKYGKKWSILFLLFCSSLCGCDPAMQARLTAWRDSIFQPIRQYQDGQMGFPSLSELLQAPDPVELGIEEKTADEELVPNEAQPVMSAQPSEQIQVKLFFLSPDGTQLLEESRMIGKVPGIARATLQELIAGPSNQQAVALFPENTTLRDIHITENGICRLDFSREIQEIATAAEEELVTLAIIKTLSQFPSVEAVQFLIEGFSVNSLTGRAQTGVQ